MIERQTGHPVHICAKQGRTGHQSVLTVLSTRPAHKWAFEQTPPRWKKKNRAYAAAG